MKVESLQQDYTDSWKPKLRNFLVIGSLATFIFAVSSGTLHQHGSSSVSDSTSTTPVLDVDSIARSMSIAGLGINGKFHQSGFGGIQNMNHPAGARARRRLSGANVIIPKSAVEHAVPSLSRENIENLHGHYVHDEHRSPFASFLYDRPKEELEAEQEEYIKKMSQVRQEWGAWDFNDEHLEIRPIANFDKTPYKDMMNKDFPKNSWQMDQKYVTDFIAEARKLVNRVREGIYAEYGHPTKDLKSEEEIQARNELFKIHITEEAVAPKVQHGWAFINRKGLEMYARKLLHSMMTNDEFYYIMGGHSAAAGHGNNFAQTYMMEFAHIMEPVLHKLGVRLIARNLAMGGLGTTHYTLGASTLYGETDVMFWDSGMTEKDAADQDLFHKQNLLGGERVPILLNGAVNNLKDETGDNLWYGNILPGWSAVPKTTGLDQGAELPWSVQYLYCEQDVGGLCNGREGVPRYHDSCWIPRSDYTPTTRQNGSGVQGKAGWHPGDRPHKFDGRKHTMLMLRALDEALDMWERGIKTDGFPLKESYWHVGDIYTSVRSHLSDYLNNEGFQKTRCESRWANHPAVKGIGLDRACRMSFKGMSEFSPINRGYHNSIQRHVKAAPNGYKPTPPIPAYSGIDVLPLFWKVPEGHVDVHAIALASTYAPSELDHSWVDDNDNDDVEEAENSRRMLRKAATEPLTILHRDTADSEPLKRELVISNKVIPGQGWVATTSATGYCDGSPMSFDCKRPVNFNCLLSGHNDERGTLQGDSLSGWLVVDIPDVKEGLIFAKLQWWHPREGNYKTKGWTEYNNGVVYSEENQPRQLKGQVIDWPQDFRLEVAINGKIVRIYTYEELIPYTKEVAYNEAFYPIIDDKGIATGDVELGLRIRSDVHDNPHHASFSLTHIYWA